MPFALYLLALAVFVMGTSEFMLAGLLPAIAADLEVTVGTAGLLTSAFAAGMVVGAPATAAFARRWPPRLTLVACLFVFAGCHVAGALTPAFPILLATRVVAALANAGFLAVALSTATALVPPGRKGRALAVVLSGTTIATVAGVPAGALLGTGLGWRATFWAVALLCVPAAFGISRRPAGADDGSAPDLADEVRQLGSPRLVLALLLAALVNGGTFAAFTFLAPVATGVAGLGEAWIAVVLVLFGAGSFLGVVIAGRLSDRRPGLVIGVGGPLLAAGWSALALTAAHPAVFLTLALTQGGLSFAVGSTLITRVLYAATGAPTMGGAYATAALNAGAAAGPALAAAVLATGAGVTAPVWVAVALTAAALAVKFAPWWTGSRRPDPIKRPRL
ncbi:chloramphenicol resistance protein [Paractinoplanes abujensis]|uniref:DHA1 family chloramphenicol resistance protein-like MFS transporter n=1 Tax=Paractinoplanes abujensis TaxID=882441 RepID=A0A7W7G247_9ACTN|nr:Cmx/CmrA family chloramphenicol efflux MFS transporter [Actinoplanes abujensis]MBB4692785.1 DHA1 family chloramphenicol resistance protein-like MFS transporter [Actinoplanes abujensis]GID22716.1 chloramphenicol resistance protein [Actinoplanes abujensis]